MSFIPKPHEIYKHFKGNLYQVTAIAEHTETGEQLVIYQDLYDQDRTYARPLSMFISRVDRVKYPDAEQEFRFQLQGPGAERQEAGLREVAEEKATERQKSGLREAVEEKEAERQESGLREAVGEKAAERQESGLREAVGEKAAERQEAGFWETAEEKEAEAAEEMPDIDPLVLEFLDSDSYEQRLNILAGLHHRITDEMITTMAIACDIEINDGDIEERYEALKTCLLTLERYECNRLR